MFCEVVLLESIGGVGEEVEARSDREQLELLYKRALDRTLMDGSRKLAISVLKVKALLHSAVVHLDFLDL